MINGLIKLFYSEIVKSKMKAMPSSDYELRDECKEIRNIALKIDSLFIKMIKFVIATAILLVAFNISTLFGVGVLLVEITYIVYKIKLEKVVKESVKNIKDNVEFPKLNIVTEKSKAGLSGLVTLLIIGVLTDFNLPIVASFVVVFIFTIKDIYSNIK